MLPRRTLRLTPLTATKPLNSLVSPRVSRMTSSAMLPLRGRALLYESIHPSTAFVVGEGARDHARGELIGLGHSEVHLLIEGALAGGKGGGRFFSELFRQAHHFRIEGVWRYDTVHQAPFERLHRV